MPPRSYATPEGYRQALETRVRAAAGPSGMGRFRQVLVYDRFLARREKPGRPHKLRAAMLQSALRGLEGAPV